MKTFERESPLSLEQHLECWAQDDARLFCDKLRMLCHARIGHACLQAAGANGEVALYADFADGLEEELRSIAIANGSPVFASRVIAAIKPEVREYGEARSDDPAYAAAREWARKAIGLLDSTRIGSDDTLNYDR